MKGDAEVRVLMIVGEVLALNALLVVNDGDAYFLSGWKYDVEKLAECLLFIFVDCNDMRTGLGGKLTTQEKPVFHQGDPRRMFVGVLVRNLRGLRVVRRVDIHTLHLLTIPSLHQRQSLKILAMHEHAIGLLIHVTNGIEQSRREACGKMPR